MATIINMPRLSDTMEEGVVASWLKNVGDTVEEGDILAEIETDKATMEFESFHEGVLLHIGVNEGDSAPVDTLLAIIGEKDEDISELLNGNTTSEKEKTTTEVIVDTPTSNTNEAVAMPEGAIVINMPRLSDTMEEGTVASWLKNVGDTVEEGDILAEIETDKATMEFESFNEGVLLHIGVEEGKTAPVDSLLAIIGKEGTDVAAVLAAQNSGNTVSEVKVEEKVAPVIETPKAVTETVTTTASGGRIFASPLAKKIAKDKGINLADVKGSGENGRIIKKDVENYTPSAKPIEVSKSESETAAAPVLNFIS